MKAVLQHSAGAPYGGIEAIPSLEGRFEAHLRATGLLSPGGSLTLALSGGLDSTVLLHLLLGLREGWRLRVTAAHFDHGLRPESAADARWVEALCRAHDVPMALGRASGPLRTEAAARRARYAFLHEARARLDAELLVTAHHADDQVETVLLRLHRGSTPDGLAGIPARRRPAIVRPLLPFRRAELEAYAAERALVHREDATNRRTIHERNRIRHLVLPYLCGLEASNDRMKDAWLAFATEVRRGRRAWARCLDVAERKIGPARDGERLVVAAPRLAAYDDAVRAQLLRRWARALGGSLGRRSLAAARRFLRTAESGTSVELGAGIVLRREYGAWVLERAPDGDERPLVVSAPEAARPGERTALVGGRRYHVRWGPEPAEAGTQAAFRVDEIVFPLVVRGRRPGDRVQRSAGGRSLKRLFADHRIPRSLRARWPVVADAREDDDVLWVPGLERSARATPAGAAEWTLTVGPLPLRGAGGADSLD